MSTIIKSYEEFINEAAVTFGGKAYPKYNQVLILAGGSGSGKGFNLNNAVAFEGKHLDVDGVKETLRNFAQYCKRVNKESSIVTKFKEFTDGKYDLAELDFGDSKQVSALHEFNKKYGYAKKINQMFFHQQGKKSLQGDNKDKDNVIFDVTFDDFEKWQDISRLVVDGGYDPRNIHIVWCMNSIDTALIQNNERERKVSANIVKSIHTNVAQFFKNIFDGTPKNSASKAETLEKSDKTKISFDEIGDIWILFCNRYENDNKYIKSSNGKGGYMQEISACCVKHQNETMPSYEEFMKMTVNKYDETGKIIGKDNVAEKLNNYIPYTGGENGAEKFSVVDFTAKNN